MILEKNLLKIHHFESFQTRPNENGIIKLNIPKNLDTATLEIKYFPESWKYILWFIPIGLSSILVSIYKLKRNRV